MNQLPVPYDLSTYAGRVNAADSSTPYALGTADKVEYYSHTPVAKGATTFRLDRETGTWHVVHGPSVDGQVGSSATIGTSGRETVTYACYGTVVRLTETTPR